MASIAQIVPVEVTTDFAFPQREAAFFYGLFLRGHAPEQLRRDIEVPPAVLLKWHRDAEREPELRDIFFTGGTSWRFSTPWSAGTRKRSACSSS